MEGASAAASIIAIATFGIKVSIKLVTLSSQISTASERVSAIGNDISLTASILQQLGDLMKQDATDSHGPVFNRGGLETVQKSALACQTVFTEIQKEIVKASVQLRSCDKLPGGKVKLSKIEMARWPFVQPSINALRDDLKEAKGTLILMLQVWILAITKRAAEINKSMSVDRVEQQEMVRTIVALKAQLHLGAGQDDGNNAQDCHPSRDEEVPQPVDSTTDWSERAPITPIQIMARRQKKEILAPRRRRGETPGDETNITPSVIFDEYSKQPDHIDTDGDEKLSRKPEPTRKKMKSANTMHIKNLLQKEAPLSNPSLINDKRIACDITNAQDEDSTELGLYQLKAVVHDNMIDSKGGVPSVELTWHIQNLDLEQSIIRYQLHEFKRQNSGSVNEMWNNLYDHEHFMLDKVLQATTDRVEGTLMALTRTSVNVDLRGMRFQQIPGLQLITRRKSSLQYDKRNILRNREKRLKGCRLFPKREGEESTALDLSCKEPVDMTLPSPLNRVTRKEAKTANLSQQSPSKIPSQLSSLPSTRERDQTPLSFAEGFAQQPPPEIPSLSSYRPLARERQTPPSFAEGLVQGSPPKLPSFSSSLPSTRERNQTPPSFARRDESPSSHSSLEDFTNIGSLEMRGSHRPPPSSFKDPFGQDDDEARIVDDLLKTYTTLFDG